MRYKQFGYRTPLEKPSLRNVISMYKTIGQTKTLTAAEKWKWVQYTRAQWKAAHKAHLLFLDALSKGEDVLEKTHERFCGKPPIPVKQPAVAQ